MLTEGDEPSGNYRIVTAREREISILYRDNSWYRAIQADLIRILTKLGYFVTRIEVLAERAHSKGIRQAVHRLMTSQNGPLQMMTDYTCLQALKGPAEFKPLQFPLGHLDSLGSEASIRSLFGDDQAAIYLEASVGQTLLAITKLFELIAQGNNPPQNCHLIKAQIAEHAPYVHALVTALTKALPERAKTMDFPPPRSDPDVMRVCDTFEVEAILQMQEAIEGAGVRTVLHEEGLTTPVAEDDLVLCDQHYLKAHRADIGSQRTLTLPLSSMIADACERALIAPEQLDNFIRAMEVVLSERHQRLRKAA